jgi:hypothetical protein
MRPIAQAYDAYILEWDDELVYSTDPPIYNGNDEFIWASALRIHQGAKKCHRYSMDQKAWCKIVHDIFNLAMEMSGSTAATAKSTFHLEVNNVQLQSIQPHFLPRIFKQSGLFYALDAKIDLVLAVDTEKTSCVVVNPELIMLSPMTDTYTSTIPLLCGIVVSHTEDKGEAILQLEIWMTAMLQHSSYLRRLSGRNEVPLPPVIGWTVQEHKWMLYIAWEDEQSPDGGISVVSIGSFDALRGLGTENMTGMFMLLRVLTKLIAWFEGAYLPMFQTLVGDAVGSTSEVLTVLD